MATTTPTVPARYHGSLAVHPRGPAPLLPGARPLQLPV
jgi:hypothetical protein